MKAFHHLRIILCTICLGLLMCSCSKPVPAGEQNQEQPSLTSEPVSPEVQIREQLDLGHKYLTELNYEQAVIAFTRVIALDPKNVAAYEGLGEASKKLGKTADAIAAFETVIELDPENTPAYLSLSEIYESAGDDAKSEEYCSRILEIDPENSDAKEALIRQYQKAAETAEGRGSYSKAVEYCWKTLDIDPEDQDAKNKLESLNILQRQKWEEFAAIAGEMYGGDHGYAIGTADFNGDGPDDCFISFDSPVGESVHWTAYYVDSSGDCQLVTEYTTEAHISFGGRQFEKDGIPYYVHTIYGEDEPLDKPDGTAIRYFVFAVLNGTPQLVSDGYEIRDEDILAGNVPL